MQLTAWVVMKIKLVTLIGASLLCLTACSTNSKQNDIPLENLSCEEILAQIDEAEIALIKAENNYSGGINNVHTGGSIGVQGGSRSGVGVGVGISIGAPFGSSRYKRAQQETEELKTRLISLQRQALAKKC